MDIALFKAHKLNPDESSALSSDYIFGWSYVEDAKSRDYTMNALYLQLFPTPMLIDPLGYGKKDAILKILRLACPEVFASDLGGQFRFWKTFISKEFSISTEEDFRLDEEVDELICDHVLWLMKFALKVEEEKKVKKQQQQQQGARQEENIRLQEDEEEDEDEDEEMARQEGDSRLQDREGEEEEEEDSRLQEKRKEREEEEEVDGQQQGQKNQSATEKLLSKLKEMKPEEPKLRKVLVESLRKKRKESIRLSFSRSQRNKSQGSNQLPRTASRRKWKMKMKRMRRRPKRKRKRRHLLRSQV